MNKIMFLLAFLVGMNTAQAQEPVEEKKRTLIMEGGITMLPYGVYSFDGGTLFPNSDAPLTLYANVTYLPFKKLPNFGFYVSGFFNQRYYNSNFVMDGNSYIETKPTVIKNGGATAKEAFVEGHSVNVGLYAGKMMTEEFEFFFKYGFGASFNYYSVHVPITSNPNLTFSGREIAPNFELVFGVRYHFNQKTSLFHSFAYAYNVPIWRSGIAFHL